MIRNILFSTLAAAGCQSAVGFNVMKVQTRAVARLSMSTSTITPDAVSVEAAARFLPDNDLKFSPTSGGVNNIVQYVETGSGHKYVLRIYNNGLNSARVNYEHEILRQLRPKKLSFKLPTTIPDLKTGKAHVVLSNGAEASLFELIPGVLPKLTRVREIGRASGELNHAMADVIIKDQKCPTPPYYELFKVHHAVTRELFYQVRETGKHQCGFLHCCQSVTAFFVHREFFYVSFYRLRDSIPFTDRKLLSLLSMAAVMQLID